MLSITGTALPLRARPNLATGLDGNERFELSAEAFSDLITVHLADHLEGWDNNMNKPGVSYIRHTIDDEDGRWRIPQHGWFGYRQSSYDAMANTLGRTPGLGHILENWHAKLATVPPGSEPAKWLPAAFGDDTPVDPATGVAVGNTAKL